MQHSFRERFLTIRDQGLAPWESWLRKKKGDSADYQKNTVELWFVRPLEYLGADDWEGMLMAGAESGYQYADFNFRHSSSLADALQLLLQYQIAYVMPLVEAYAIGGVFSAPNTSRTHTVGTLSVSLYADRDIPPEHRRRKISAKEFHALLDAFGCEQRDIPSLLKH